MFSYERGRQVNKRVENALQDVEQLMNLIEVLARATGDFINSCASTKDDKCFSDNVSEWLFVKNNGTKNCPTVTVLREDEENEDCSSCCNNEDDCCHESEEDIPSTPKQELNYIYEERKGREEIRERPNQSRFSSLGSYADGQNLASSYYSNLLVSNHLSSNAGYVSPKSKYLSSNPLNMSSIREQLAALTAQGGNPSYCDLVGPISTPECIDAIKEAKKCTAGVTVAINGSSYSRVKSCIDKSKSLFGDFVSPDNSHYKSPLGKNRRQGLTSLRY